MTNLPEPNPINADRRRARKAVKLPADASCLFCGIAEPDVLIVSRRVIEGQHVLGEETAPGVVVALCRNCHAIATGRQLDHEALPPPGPPRRPDSLPETTERALRGLAVFAHDLAHWLVAWADRLRDFWQGLDDRDPSWRDEPWAKGAGRQPPDS